MTKDPWTDFEGSLREYADGNLCNLNDPSFVPKGRELDTKTYRDSKGEAYEYHGGFKYAVAESKCERMKRSNKCETECEHLDELRNCRKDV